MQTLNDDNARIDFGIGEDADLITITDVQYQAKLVTKQDHISAAERNEAFIVSLPEDGGIGGRLVLGALNDDESGTWVARACRTLDLPSGQLVIDAGDFLGNDGEPDTGYGPNYIITEVEPGRYQLMAYVYLCSNIATDLLQRRKLTYIEWFRQSFPSSPVPYWLIELAEDRDNDDEEEILEELKDEDIDDEGDDSFVEVLFQLEPAQPDAQQTELTKSGGPKWEKRIPKSFPTPPLTSHAAGSRGAFPKAKSVASAFRKQNFEAATKVFVDRMQAEVKEFLGKQHAFISGKMTIPSRIQRGESYRTKEDWEAKYDHPLAVVDLPTLRRQPFRGNAAVSLVDNSHRDQDVYVSISLAFVSTDNGLEAAAMSIEWKAPRKRPVRRRRR